MKTTQKHYTLFIISVVILSLFLYIVLEPKVSSVLFPFVRSAHLTQFIKETQKNGYIDPQSFWKLRDFYDAGTIQFDRAGLTDNTVQSQEKKIGADSKWNIGFPFLIFTSKKFNSFDQLVNNQQTISLESFMKNEPHTLFKNKTSLIYKKNNTYYIVGLFNPDEMKSVNGFLDYKDQDKNLTQGKSYLTVSRIDLE